MNELRRVLTLRDLVLIVVGTTIGSGIFTVPGAVLRQSGGDLGVALAVWATRIATTKRRLACVRRLTGRRHHA